MRIVTGTGRCGTSMVCNLLMEAGADFGQSEDRSSPDAFNPRGYFEYPDVIRLNTHLVTGAPLTLLQRNALKPSPLSGMLIAACKTAYLFTENPAAILRRASRRQADMQAILNAHGKRIIKDVRFSMTLTAWRRVTNVERALYCYRHPSEVARSFARVYRIPLKMGYRMWIRRAEQFFEQADGVPLVLVDYNRLLAKTHQIEEMQRLFRFIDKSAEENEARALIARTVDPREETAAPSQVPRGALDVYERLQALHERHAAVSIFRASDSDAP